MIAGITITLLVLVGCMISVNAYHAPEYVPDWVKRTSILYDTGHITAEEFLNMLHYVMDVEIVDLGDVPGGLNSGVVTKVIDGNTLEIDGNRVRLSLVDVVDSGNMASPHAVLANALCPVGSVAHYDTDDDQGMDRYGRIVAMVYCDSEASLNQLLLEFGMGWIAKQYCQKSEFGQDWWTRGYCFRPS